MKGGKERCQEGRKGEEKGKVRREERCQVPFFLLTFKGTRATIRVIRVVK
jgi:hypothetical protein